MPFLIQWKGQLPANRVYENPVISLDIFATAAALSNALLDERKVHEGFNLIPYLKGEKNSRPHDTLFWSIYKRSAIRVGDWKLLRNPAAGKVTNGNSTILPKTSVRPTTWQPPSRKNALR